MRDLWRKFLQILNCTEKRSNSRDKKAAIQSLEDIYVIPKQVEESGFRLKQGPGVWQSKKGSAF